MNKKLLIVAIIAMFACNAFAQKFLPAFDTFSSNDAFLVNKKGDTVKFTLKDLDRKKGLIYDVAGVTADGKKFDYKAEEIQVLGLIPSGFSKLTTKMETTSNVNRMKKQNMSALGRKYAIFFLEYLEDKKLNVLVQLVNPDFSEKISVYHDPYAKKTAGIGYGGMQFTGGNDKSYYVKYDGKTFRLFKSTYDDFFKKLANTCPSFKEKFATYKWNDFEEQIYYYDNNCN